MLPLLIGLNNDLLIRILPQCERMKKLFGPSFCCVRMAISTSWWLISTPKGTFHHCLLRIFPYNYCYFLLLFCRPHLQGPLTITPSQTHNYGTESCSILVIPSVPPTIVIAEKNGKLHHAMFLESTTAGNVCFEMKLLFIKSNTK